MDDSLDASPVRVGVTQDGTRTYLVDRPPEAMPPVRLRDLDQVWDAARHAALRADWGAALLFRFRRADGSCTDLALADSDACCWARAVDGSVGMHTSYGVSLCLRLLALVDLLARARWADALFTLRRDGAAIHPALLRATATASLTAEARFDPQAIQALVARDLPERRALTARDPATNHEPDTRVLPPPARRGTPSHPAPGALP